MYRFEQRRSYETRASIDVYRLTLGSRTLETRRFDDAGTKTRLASLLQKQSEIEILNKKNRRNVFYVPKRDYTQIERQKEARLKGIRTRIDLRAKLVRSRLEYVS